MARIHGLEEVAKHLEKADVEAWSNAEKLEAKLYCLLISAM